MDTSADLLETEGDWIVCHTRARAEKKFSALLRAEHFPHYLPLFQSVREYGRQTKTFSKPLFPSYVFARVPAPLRRRLYQQDLLARVIPVEDQASFLRQVRGIRAVLSAGLALTLRLVLARGRAVKIIAGPLRGVEGRVENAANPEVIIVAVDILRQGLTIRVPIEWIEALPE